MPYRSPARFLAPLAVIVAAASVYLIVHGTLSDEPSGATTTPTTTVAHKAPKHAKRTYTVRPGDTLSAIASRTGVALDRLEELNPSIDPNALHTGQKLKLRPAS